MGVRFPPGVPRVFDVMVACLPSKQNVPVRFRQDPPERNKMVGFLIVLALYALVTFGLYTGVVASFFSKEDRRDDIFPHVWSLFVAMLTPFAVTFLGLWWTGKLLKRMWK